MLRTVCPGPVASLARAPSVCSKTCNPKVLGESLKMVNSPKWLGEGEKGGLSSGSKSLPRVFCTIRNPFCTGATSFCTGTTPFSLPGLKRPFAPSPNHLGIYQFRALSQNFRIAKQDIVGGAALVFYPFFVFVLSVFWGGVSPFIFLFVLLHPLFCFCFWRGFWKMFVSVWFFLGRDLCETSLDNHAGPSVQQPASAGQSLPEPAASAAPHLHIFLEASLESRFARGPADARGAAVAAAVSECAPPAINLKGFASWWRFATLPHQHTGDVAEEYKDQICGP